MEAFALQVKKFAYFVTLQPATPDEFWVRLIIGVFACTAMLVLSAHVFRMSFPSFTSALIITSVSGGALILIAALSHLYFKQAQIFSGIGHDEFTWGVFVVVSLLVVIPLIRSTWCGSYLNSAICWGSALVVFALSCIAVGGVFSEGDVGANIVSKQRQLTQSVQHIIEEKFPAHSKRR